MAVRKIREAEAAAGTVVAGLRACQACCGVCCVGRSLPSQPIQSVLKPFSWIP